MSYTLRSYQQRAVDAALSVDNGVLVLPTGSGKSLVIAEIVRRLAGRCIVLQPTREILESNLAKIKLAGVDASVYSASLGVKEIGVVTYATIQSIIGLAPRFAGTLEALIIDEAHLVNAKGGQYEQFIQQSKPKRLYGLTATPYRLHSTSLGSDLRMITRTRPKLFYDIAHATQCDELIASGHLLRPEYVVSDLGHRHVLTPNSTRAEYSDHAIERYLRLARVHERTAETCMKALSDHARHVLIFLPTLSDCARVLALLKNWRVATVSSETPSDERAQTLRDFRRGIINAVINVGVLTVGYDFPALDCIIEARPTLSLGLYYQIIGRCVRPYNNKRPVVYDLVNNFERFGDPLAMRIFRGRTGLCSVLSAHGRLTNRPLDACSECNDEIMFGKYRGYILRELPSDYLRWYMDNSSPSATWHQFDAELARREIYGVQNESD